LPDPSGALERIEVRFATFRDSDAHERVGITERLRTLRTGESVLIDTCHRAELISVDAEPEAGALEAGRRGLDAVRRVFEVVAGFDSAVVAEEQLLGQVRGAYEDALATRQTGPILNELMRRALRFGRLVRSHARPGTDRSLADPAVAWLRERLQSSDRVLVVGTGEMGRLVAHRLAVAGHPVIIASSSAERGGRLVEELSGEDHHLVVGPLGRELMGVDGMALAVRTRAPVLTAALLPAQAEPWVLDLSAPPAVEQAVADRLGDRFMSLDQLGEHHGSAPVLDPDAEARLRLRLDHEVADFAAWLESRRSGDALALLHRDAEEVRHRHLDRLRRRAGLDEAQLAAVEAASAAMIGELLHGPTLELRRGGVDADTVRRMFRIDA
jgi:glutamyl-tRNA reductase